jgi:hypothetical protein
MWFTRDGIFARKAVARGPTTATLSPETVARLTDADRAARAALRRLEAEMARTQSIALPHPVPDDEDDAPCAHD